MLSDKKIILASGSPRRRELMEQMELKFTVDCSGNFEEKIPEGLRAEDVPAYLAKGKSFAFPRELNEDEILVTADTIVVCDGTILGKPHDAETARRMLHLLSGRKHEVVSAVCVRTSHECNCMSDTASVQFTELSDETVGHYVERYSPLDKAGAYGIQEWIGLIGISRIEGSFYTIMGLPTHLLSNLLERAGMLCN